MRTLSSLTAMAFYLWWVTQRTARHIGRQLKSASRWMARLARRTCPAALRSALRRMGRRLSLSTSALAILALSAAHKLLRTAFLLLISLTLMAALLLLLPTRALGEILRGMRRIGM